MAQPLIVGIADHVKDVMPVHAALVAAGLDPSRLSIVTADGDSMAAFAEAAGVRFIHAHLGELESGLITSSGGTDVPAITRAGLGGLDHRYSPEDALADAGVPESAAEVLGEAVEAGKAVFVFHVADAANAPKVAESFTGAGLHAVRTHDV